VRASAKTKGPTQTIGLDERPHANPSSARGRGAFYLDSAGMNFFNTASK